MTVKGVAWFLILSYVAALVIAAPISSEESTESSEASTTIGAATLPGNLPSSAGNSEVKRETEKQTTEKPKAGPDTEKFLTKPSEPGVPADRVARSAPQEDKPVPEPLPSKPAESTFDIKKDEPIEKRQAEENQEAVPKPTAPESSPESKPEASPPAVSTLPAIRPVRDVEGVGQPEKSPCLTDCEAQDEQREKRSTDNTEAKENSESSKNPQVLQRPLSTIPEESHTRTRRAAGPQGSFNRQQPQPPRPQTPNRNPGPQNNRPGSGPQNNRPGSGPQYNHPGSQPNNRPGSGPQNNRPGPGRRP